MLSRLLSCILGAVFVFNFCVGDKRFALGSEADNEAYNRCGRDAICQTLQSFGKDIPLEAVDESLGHKNEVSVAEVRRALQRFGFESTAEWIDPDDIEAFAAHQKELAHREHIVVIPPSRSEWWHFAFVHSLSAEGIEFVQPPDGEIREIAFASLSEDKRLGLITVLPPEPINAWSASWISVLDLKTTGLILLGLLGLFVAVFVIPARSARRDQRISWRFVMGFAMIGVTATGAWLGVRSEPAKPVRSAGLSFESSEYRAGSLLTATEHPVIVRVVNRSQRPVQVSEVRTSCGCVRVEPDQFEVAAGMSKELRVDVKPATEREISQTVQLLNAEGRVAAETKISYIGRLPARLTPMKWNVGPVRMGDSGQLLKKTLTVTDYVGPSRDDVRIEAVGKFPLFHATWCEDVVFEKDAELPIELRPTNHTFRGLFTQKIRITFGDVAADELSLELNVSGEAISAAPND